MGTKSGKKPAAATESPLLSHTLQLLRRYDLRARKELGQNFLVDAEILERIITAAELTPADLVVEIGPGLGVLTEQLAQRAGRVIAIELDDNLAGILKQRLSAYRNVTIINADVLKTDMAALIEEQTVKLPPGINPGSYKVVANLPYYITSPTLRHLLEATAKPKTMVVMVQKEVAEQITAKPGKLSLMGISIQLYGAPTLVTKVPASSFYPEPKVDSAVLRIEIYPQPAVDIGDSEGFFKIVRAGFSHARKQLHNSLERGLLLPREDVLALLAKADIDIERRAQTLTLEEWARLWRIFAGGEAS